MTPTKYTLENTRELGTGERIDQSCLIRFHGDEVLYPVTADAYGEIITGDEMAEYRRPIMCGGTITELHVLADHLGLKTEVGRKALELALSDVQLLDSKHQDYGPGNIAAHGEYGVLVRCSDKLARLTKLLTNVQEPKHESIDDSWKDLTNYGLIARIFRAGNWR